LTVTSVRKRIAFTAILVLIPFVILALIEGTASFALFARSLSRVQLAEESSTERDTLVGWINKASYNRPNMYAPGIGYRTNGQRFRHDGDVAPTPPAGKRRVVCSGDSFTLGYGVNDRQGWCAQLSESDASLETVNMGQGGYGLDQAYLWYLRDGLKLRPNVHLFAFITNDFHRMQKDQFRGYPKPTLALKGDGVVPVGVPVRRPGFGPASDKLAGTIRELKTFELYDRLFPPTRAAVDRPARDSATWEVARAALRDLARRDSAIGATLVVIYLPIQDDYKHGGADQFRRLAHRAADHGEFQFVDLIEPYRAVRADSVTGMFIQEGVLPFKGAAGHYTPIGNAWVAEQLRRLVPALGAPPAIVASKVK
jgi:hypothetical protein